MRKDFKEKYRDFQKRRRNIVIISIVLTVFIVGNLYIFHEISKVKDIFNPYVFLLIININVVFFLGILAISLRHLIKLFFEKEQPAGKLRKKLSFILISMVIIPAMILSVASISLISNATNLWFSGKVERALNSLEKITDENLKEYSQFLKEVVYLLENKKITPYEAFKKFNIRSMVILDNNRKPLIVYGKPIKKLSDKDFKRKRYIFEYRGNHYLKFISRYEKNKYIVIEYRLPPFLSKYKKDLEHISDVYSKFRYYKNPIRVSYIVTMLTITMFVIFAALWFSQYVVRNLTFPLEKLVEASKKLASGDLNIKVGIKAPDEIGILIEEFNKMVDELKELYIKLERSNKDLKANKEYLEAILENARTGVIYSNRFGKIENINKAASDILGVNPENLKNRDITEFMNSIGIDIYNLDREQTLNLNGKIIIAKLTKLSPRGYILVFDDITDIVAAEKVLAWKEIAKRIAHEIKNPLTPIRLSAERIKRQYENKNPKFPEILDKAVNVIHTEVDYLSKLVKDFSQFASSGINTELEEINLKRLFDELKNSYQTDGFEINLDIDDDLRIKADKKQIRQAFLNIIQNSFESVEDGRGKLNIKAEKKDGKVRIIFKDNGKGIDIAELDKVFIPYYSKKSKGSGLGLAITKEIIENHKGSIKALPSERGAVFEVILPVT
ncbi:MAG TPA: HAMP domain-containing protein [Persephonella sp.]|uniref:histidine kinase n=1 Tax=Persephonella marina (strain DSM 14350 / EX-H1) TaxID=123214 RepID=C0QQ81_PERMH|nr:MULTISPECIES: ATP-binding protein [Persephonella]ACO04402.1 putative nitrogen regulation protein NtrY [Persephonella marina EX-H1]HCB69566.1 HAMP domain-containing protein [Persephonella sp.]